MRKLYSQWKKNPIFLHVLASLWGIEFLTNKLDSMEYSSTLPFAWFLFQFGLSTSWCDQLLAVVWHGETRSFHYLDSALVAGWQTVHFLKTYTYIPIHIHFIIIYNMNRHCGELQYLCICSQNIFHLIAIIKTIDVSVGFRSLVSDSSSFWRSGIMLFIFFQINAGNYKYILNRVIQTTYSLFSFNFFSMLSKLIVGLTSCRTINCHTSFL